MYWTSAANAAVIALAALPRSWPSPSRTAVPDAMSERRASDGRHALLAHPPHQLWLIDDPPPGTPLGVIIPLDDSLPHRLAAALTLWRTLTGKPPLAGAELTRPRHQRLILGLRALDGRADGASHRALARGLFGAANVPDGPAWKAHDLRSRTIRLVTDAMALRDSGYRRLLDSSPQLKA